MKNLNMTIGSGNPCGRFPNSTDIGNKRERDHCGGLLSDATWCSTPTLPSHARFSPSQTLHESYRVGDEILVDCLYDETQANQTLTCGYYGDWGANRGQRSCPEACASSPCFGGATCVNLRHDYDGGYMCLCPLGYEGKDCDLLQTGTSPPCGQNFHDRTGVLTSPNYPNDYDSDHDCSYLIRISNADVINLTVNDFSSEIEADYLSLGAGFAVHPENSSSHADYPKLTGDLNPLQRKDKYFNFESSQVWLHWHADEDDNAGGFNISFSSVIFSCSHSPCWNNATCVDLEDGSSECICQAGWKGRRCRKNIDDCVDSLCVNGECEDEVNGYHCDCQAGWTGQTCEHRSPATPPPSTVPTVIITQAQPDLEPESNECIEQPCGIGGKCYTRAEGHYCKCYTGYTGNYCERSAATSAPTRPPSASSASSSSSTSSVSTTLSATTSRPTYDYHGMADKHIAALVTGLFAMGVLVFLAVPLVACLVRGFLKMRARRNRISVENKSNQQEKVMQGYQMEDNV